MLELTDVAKSFRDVRALDGVSFRAENGKITGVLGPNGAGKTTALRILYTVLQQDSGRASVDGFDTLEEPREVQKRIGVLPDAHGLYPRLTSRENVRYFGRLHGLSGETLEREIDALVRLLDMDEIADRRTEGFSTGQRVKVAIARALVQRPRNVLLDEPTSGLDVPSTRAMRDFIRRLRDDGVAVVFSSHIMQEVSALCDHIVVLSRGTVVASGSPDELRRLTGKDSLEDAFVSAIGSEEGLE
jgi:sodium transport system ATP-binding protein